MDKEQHTISAAGPSRRDVIKVVSLALGGAVAGVGSAALLPQLDRIPSPWRFFTVAEAQLAEAICEQIIPADKDPGAKDAGTVNFIDVQLVGPYQRYQAKYRQGLACVDKTCQALHHKNFLALSWDDQTTLLKALESGRVSKDIWHDPAPHEFFGLIRDHTLQGFYGSPRHGGNKDFVSFKMLGLEYPRILGQNRYLKT